MVASHLRFLEDNYYQNNAIKLSSEALYKIALKYLPNKQSWNY
jgi:hypothetical protein